MKDPKQRDLLNTGSMASSKSLRNLKRQREVERLRLQRKTRCHVSNPPMQDVEFNLPDESRYWMVYAGSCHLCGYNGQSEMRVNPGPPKTYSVKCSMLACENKTPEFKTSQDAIRHWKLVAVLSR